MKIALINPKSHFLTSHDVLRENLEKALRAGMGKEFTTSPNPALLTIAALTPQEHHVDYFDEACEALPASGDYDIVGISAQTRQAKRAYEIAAEFKKRGCHTVLGGIHATFRTDEACRFVDTVFVGEAEETWPLFLDDFRCGKTEKIYRGERLVSLEKSPCPAYHKAKDENYQNVAILTHRGCPSQCCFCTIPQLYGARMRRKSVEQVVREVTTVLSTWKKKPTIYFGDENFFIDRHYARSLIEEIAPLKIKWNTKATADVCEEEELLALAYDSGLRKLQIGLESVDPQSLEAVDDRGRKLRFFEKYDHYSAVIEKIQKHCISVVANFVFGFDNEDLSIFEKTARFLENNPIAGPRLAFLVPFPGTALYEKLKAENRLCHEDWEKYTNFEVLFRHPHMEKESMQEAFLDLMQKANSPQRIAAVAEYFKGKLLERRENQAR